MTVYNSCTSTDPILRDYVAKNSARTIPGRVCNNTSGTSRKALNFPPPPASISTFSLVVNPPNRAQIECNFSLIKSRSSLGPPGSRSFTNPKGTYRKFSTKGLKMRPLDYQGAVSLGDCMQAVRKRSVLIDYYCTILKGALVDVSAARRRHHLTISGRLYAFNAVSFQVLRANQRRSDGPNHSRPRALSAWYSIFFRKSSRP